MVTLTRRGAIVPSRYGAKNPVSAATVSSGAVPGSHAARSTPLATDPGATCRSDRSRRVRRSSPVAAPIQARRVREMHRRALLLKPIDDPIPAVGRFDHHLRVRTRVRNRCCDRQRIIRHADRSQLLARRVLPHDHRTPTMKVDPDILSIRRGLPSSEEEMVCGTPSLQQELGTLTRSGGPAPSSQQLGVSVYCPLFVHLGHASLKIGRVSSVHVCRRLRELGPCHG
jgi:hypothetical protein